MCPCVCVCKSFTRSFFIPINCFSLATSSTGFVFVIQDSFHLNKMEPSAHHFCYFICVSFSESSLKASRMCAIHKYKIAWLIWTLCINVYKKKFNLLSRNYQAFHCLTYDKHGILSLVLDIEIYFWTPDGRGVSHFGDSIFSGAACRYLIVSMRRSFVHRYIPLLRTLCHRFNVFRMKDAISVTELSHKSNWVEYGIRTG